MASPYKNELEGKKFPPALFPYGKSIYNFLQYKDKDNPLKIW